MSQEGDRKTFYSSASNGGDALKICADCQTTKTPRLREAPDGTMSAILGMHSIVSWTMVIDGSIVPRPMIYVALTYDHRLIDGREAALPTSYQGCSRRSMSCLF